MERERERRISYLNEDIKSIKIAKEGFDKQILQRKDDTTEIFELRRCDDYNSNDTNIAATDNATVGDKNIKYANQKIEDVDKESGEG